jgi:hypothetical protein
MEGGPGQHQGNLTLISMQKGKKNIHYYSHEVILYMWSSLLLILMFFLLQKRDTFAEINAF